MNRLWFYILLIMMLLSSCVSEVVIPDIPEHNDESYLSVQSYGLRSGGTYAGDMDDFIVQSFRILAFNGSGQCVSNVSYDGTFNEIIVHPIDVGIYNFVFLANEPDNAVIKTQLDNITLYSDLDDVAYPASSFSSDTLIPMMQEIKNVEVLKDGVSKTNGILNPSPIQLSLDRLGARLDVTLKAEEDLDVTFTGITLSNIPDKVPLTSNYTGTVNRNQTRSFTVTGNSEYFSDTTIIESGIVWGKNIKRIIVPSNDFTPSNDKNKAIVFTVNLEGKYNPACELKRLSSPENYTLPVNSKLNLLAKVRMPLELNITASEWEKSDSEWNTNYRTLNVSQVEANITDFNGVRISFWSNMPKVRVLPQAYVGVSGSTTAETNKVFNDLAITDGSNSTTRFSYDPATGSGYMDILVDTVDIIGTTTYRLILSAEEADGSNTLQREIKIHVTQLGSRPGFQKWLQSYVGVFHRNNEKGERVITGQHFTNYPWTATVVTGADFIELSSTPSLDPGIGTDNPGDPELFPVMPNQYKNENGTTVSGKGRIYFRVGMKSVNTNGTPRYGLIRVNYQGGLTYRTNLEIYVRQGEDADYVWRPEDIVPASGIVGNDVLNGRSRDAARKFSPYNLTAPAFKADNDVTYQQLDINGGVFVDYPTQGGAYFQWGVNHNDATFDTYVRRAYHPTKSISLSDWFTKNFYAPPIWDPPTGYAYKSDGEVCPEGYHRPSDGPTDVRAFNGPYYHANLSGTSPDPEGDYSSEIEYSNIRVSLLKIPLAGNGRGNDAVATYPPSRELDGTRMGFYADGFFDRRPMDSSSKTVSTNSAHKAFPGILYFNTGTYASLFLPSSGRLNNRTAAFEGINTGYYWSSSTAPWYETAEYGVWGFESSYYVLRPVSSLGGFGHSIRCVKD